MIQNVNPNLQSLLNFSSRTLTLDFILYSSYDFIISTLFLFFLIPLPFCLKEINFKKPYRKIDRKEFSIELFNDEFLPIFKFFLLPKIP